MFSRNAYEFNKILFIIIINKKKRIYIRITSVTFMIPAFRNVRINSIFRFLQKRVSAI